MVDTTFLGMVVTKISHSERFNDVGVDCTSVAAPHSGDVGWGSIYARNVMWRFPRKSRSRSSGDRASVS